MTSNFQFCCSETREPSPRVHLVYLCERGPRTAAEAQAQTGSDPNCVQVDQAEDQHAAWNRAGARLRVLPRQPHHRLGRPSCLQVCPITEQLLGGACQSACDSRLMSTCPPLQVGHDGLLHVSLPSLVHRRLHPADRSAGTVSFILKSGAGV